jgi:hypothetical protein
MHRAVVAVARPADDAVAGVRSTGGAPRGVEYGIGYDTTADAERRRTSVT